LKNLKEFCLEVNISSSSIRKWINQLSQLEPMKNLKKYNLQLLPDYYGNSEKKQSNENSFLDEWSQNIQKLPQLESLSFSLEEISISSFDFLTNTLSSLSNLKNLRIIIKLSDPQLELSIPWHKLLSLETVEIQLRQANFEDELEWSHFEDQHLYHLEDTKRDIKSNFLKDLDPTYFKNFKSVSIIAPRFDENVLLKFKNSEEFSAVEGKKGIKITKNI